MLQKNKLLIRMESGKKIGFGHAMRCLALAQAWKERGGQAVFHMRNDSFLMMKKFLRDQFKVVLFAGNIGSEEDVIATASISKKVNADWIVVDGYQFDENYQIFLKKKSGLKLFWIDDYGHAASYIADIVLNQNTSADEAMYSNRLSETRILLGTNYAMLRKEFWRWRNWQRTRKPKVGHVLITLGGGDSMNMIQNVTSVLDDLSKKNDMVFTVVSGCAQSKCSKAYDVEIKSHRRIRFLSNVLDMSPLMAEADLAISASGSICWEMAFMGLPAIVYSLALNQEGIARTLDTMGVVKRVHCCEPFNKGELLGIIREICDDVDLRQCMSDAGRRLVDGRGGLRVVEIMKELAA